MTSASNDLIINFAPTGMVPQKSDHPSLPVGVNEIVDDVLEACELGITSVHLHARDTAGQPTCDPDRYAEIITRIRSEQPELVICVSLSGRNQPGFDQRAAALDLTGETKPDMGSLTLSSLNFVQQASLNAPETVARLAQRMADRGIVPEMEVFDVGMINIARYLISKATIQPPLYFNLVLGNIATAQMDLLHLGLLVKELPSGALWSVGGIGRHQLPANLVAIATGSGVRVGLEDNLYMDSDRQVRATNAALIRRVHAMAELAGRSVMPPHELRGKMGMNPGRGLYGRG